MIYCLQLLLYINIFFIHIKILNPIIFQLLSNFVQPLALYKCCTGSSALVRNLAKRANNVLGLIQVKHWHIHTCPCENPSHDEGKDTDDVRTTEQSVHQKSSVRRGLLGIEPPKSNLSTVTKLK